ncbi:hypothetical protein P692DRAFT_201689277, partial [Suillus brevipes Sb2]
PHAPSSAQLPSLGMASTTPSQSASTKPSGPKMASNFAPPGNEKRAAIAPSMTRVMSAQAAAPSLMELSAALERRKSNP